MSKKIQWFEGVLGTKQTTLAAERRHVFWVFVLIGCSLLPNGAVAQAGFALPAGAEGPSVFAPGVISTDAIEYSVTFLPDGNTLYFTRRASWGENPAIYESRYEQGAWQPARVVGFSGTYSDEYPSLSPDGSRLYFASKRPVTGSAPQSSNDIWYVERTRDGWGEPQHVGAPISSDFIDSHPFITQDGSMFFHSNRAGSSVNIYLARFESGRFAEPVPAPFNSDATDGEACTDSEEKFVIFYSEREGTLGKGDLYVAYRENETGWGSPVNLGVRVNTPEYEWTPSISPDDRYLFYAHLNGNDSDIYQIRLEHILKR